MTGRSVRPTPTSNRVLPFRLADFGTLSEALDYAARGETGLNFYDPRRGLEAALTYGELRRRARELGRRLLGLGLSRGDRVAILATMDPDFVCVFFGCQYAGLVAVPLPVPTGLGARETYEENLRCILQTSRPRVAVGSAQLMDHLRRAADGLALDRVTTTAELAGLAPAAHALEPLGPDELSHIQYSSGSTRHPKGILIGQKALMENARAIGRHGLRLSPGDRAASWLPFYHDMGLIGFLVGPVTCQITVDCIPSDGFARRPLQWLRLISDNRCSVAFSPTFGYDLCVRRAADARRMELDLSCWRVAGVGGEMIRPDALARFAETFGPHGFRDEAFVPSYGLAEATLAVSFSPLGEGVKADRVDKEALVAHGIAATPRSQGNGNGEAANARPDRLRREARTFVACGKPLPGYRVEVRDEAGVPLPDRRVGRIFVKGPSLMEGYYGDAKATARTLHAGGWLDTGDMGYLANGALVITGRQKDPIIINGRNIWPQDLEWIAEHTVTGLRIRDTAAFGVVESDDTEVAVILVQCRSQDTETRERLLNDVRSAIFLGAGIDCRVVLVPPRSLPYTTSGKLSRAKARQAYLSGAFEEADPRHPTAAPPVQGPILPLKA